MEPNKHRVHYRADLTGTGTVWVVTWNEDAYYNEDTATAALWNKTFKSSPGRMVDGQVVDQISTRDVISATVEYAKLVASRLGCDVLERK